MSTIKFQASAKDGVIEIPKQYLQRVSSSQNIQVVILPEGEEDVKTSPVSTTEQEPKTDLLLKLLKHPIRVEDSTPIKRDEIYDR